MKQARKINVPDRVLTVDEVAKIKRKCRNSAVYQVTQFDRSRQDIANRLHTKGVPDVVHVAIDNNVNAVDVVNELLDELENENIVNDERSANFISESMFLRGKSVSAVRDKLRDKLFDNDLIDTLIDDYVRNNPNDELEALDKTAQKVVKRSKFNKKDEYQKRDYFVQSMVRQGFSMNDVFTWVNSHGELFVGDYDD